MEMERQLSRIEWEKEINEIANEQCNQVNVSKLIHDRQGRVNL